MNLVKITALIALVSLISGCATVSRTKDLSNKIYPDASTASLDTKPLVDVQYDKRPVVLDIDDDMSPSIRRSKDARDYFESFQVDGKQGQKFHLVVGAVLHFLGFHKTSIFPIAKLYDSEGKLIAEGKRDHIPTVVELRGTFPHSGTYHLVVIADGTHEDEKIGEIQGFSPLDMTLFPVGVEVSTEGKVQVSWRKS